MLPALPTGMHSASISPRRAPRTGLEGRGLLALQAKRVDAVDQRDRVALGQLAYEREGLVSPARWWPRRHSVRKTATAADVISASTPVA